MALRDEERQEILELKQINSALRKHIEKLKEDEKALESNVDRLQVRRELRVRARVHVSACVRVRVCETACVRMAAFVRVCERRHIEKLKEDKKALESNVDRLQVRRSLPELRA